MISLLASQTVAKLEALEKVPEKSSQGYASDSDTEIFNLLPKNRQLRHGGKQQKQPMLRCRAFVAFLSIVTMTGFLMLAVMAAFGEFTDSEKNFNPIAQTSVVKQDPELKTEVVIQSIASYRLPKNLVPIKYKLNLDVTMGKALLSGSVEIETVCEKEADMVVLHSVGHEIIKVWITEPSTAGSIGKGINVTKIGKDPVNGFLILHLSANLRRQHSYVLKINFKSNISQEADGFHFVSTGNGMTRSLAITELEPVYARRMFPCFDEPELRATFKIIVTHSDKMKATTLMPLAKSIQLNKDLVKDHFIVTPPIPTHLLWLMIGQLTEEETITQTGVTIQKFSSITDKFLSSLTSTVINTGMKILRVFLRVKYPAPKLDVACLPESAKGDGLGFMVLPNLNVSSAPIQKYNFMRITSEKLVKIWLDGLLHINWWTDHWLIHGLSIFISQNEIIRKLQPKLNTRHLFYMMYTQPALKRDQNKMSALTLSKKVDSNRDAIEKLNSFYGDKAAVLINMLSSIIGKKALRKGIQDFVKRKQRNGTSSKQFFVSLSKFTKQIRGEGAMKEWINNPGYPVVHLQYTRKTRKVHVTQLSSLASRTSNKRVFWRLPLRFKLSSKTGIKRVNLNKRRVAFHVPTKFQWIKANFGQTGFYRVKYDEGLWKSLVKALIRNHTIFPEIDRAGLVDDAMSLARAGKLSYKSALEILPYLKKEHSFLVWKIAVQHFNDIFALFQGHKHSFCIKKYLFGLMKHMVDGIGWSNRGSLIERKLRQEMLEFSGTIGDKKTIRQYKKMFFEIISSTKSYNLPIRFRRFTFKAAVRNGGDQEWRMIMKLYRTSKKNQRLALFAAAASRSAPKVENFMKQLLNDKKPFGTILLFLRELASNHKMKRLTWKLVKEHWSTLEKRSNGGKELIQFIGHLIMMVNDRKQLIDAESFSRTHVKKIDDFLLIWRKLEKRRRALLKEAGQRRKITFAIEELSNSKC